MLRAACFPLPPLPNQMGYDKVNSLHTEYVKAAASVLGTPKPDEVQQADVLGTCFWRIAKWRTL